MGDTRFRTKLISATEGTVASITDLVLAQLFFVLLLPGRRSPYDITKAAEEAQEILRQCNYDAIKHALYHLSRRRFITRSPNRSHTEIAITEIGKNRMDALFPTYRVHRPWNGYLYLVSYDIPASANKKRNLLREQLRRTGAAILQDSLWVTPYAPHGLVDKFVKTYAPGGTILISKLGHDGAIGEEKLEELIARVYRLNLLARDYQEFVKMYSHPPVPSRLKISLAYFAILKRDPQLPFELLPKNFPDKAAYHLYQTLMHN